MPVTFDEIYAKLHTFPGVEDSTFMDTPGFKVRRKTLGRWRREADPDSFMLAQVDAIERQVLCDKDPDVYYYTQHYASGPYILIRMSKVDRDELWELLEQSWRRLASQRQLAQHEASRVLSD